VQLKRHHPNSYCCCARLAELLSKIERYFVYEEELKNECCLLFNGSKTHANPVRSHLLDAQSEDGLALEKC